MVEYVLVSWETLCGCIRGVQFHIRIFAAERLSNNSPSAAANRMMVRIKVLMKVRRPFVEHVLDIVDAWTIAGDCAF